MSIGERIMQLRKEAGLSQEAFAEKLGVSRQSVSKWESDSATPDVNKAIAICELFGVSSDYLLCGKENPPAPEASIDENFEEKTYEEVYIGEENPEEIYEEVNEAETAEEKNDSKDESRKDN